MTDLLFLRLCGANPDLRLERTAAGELIIMAPAGFDTGGRNLRLSGQLYNRAESNDHGIAFDSSAGFTLPDGAIRSPDASWVESDRWDALVPDEQKDFAPLGPASSSSCAPPATDSPTSATSSASIAPRGSGSAG